MAIADSMYQVSGINIGPVHKKDVMRAASMLEKAKELAVILCFDVPVDKEAEKLADELGIKIFKGICPRHVLRSLYALVLIAFLNSRYYLSSLRCFQGLQCCYSGS